MPRRLKAFYSDHFELPLPAKHRFPMAKYRLLRQRLSQGPIRDAIELSVADAATDEQLLLVHDHQYLTKLQRGTLTPLEERRIGFPWSPQMVERSRRSTGATIAAARASRRDGIGVNLAGGTHHAFPDRGQGYCIFNDVAVTIRVLQSENLIKRAVVIDCDVHQGNGTAAIFAGDDSTFTFSIHGERNFPFCKHAGDLDVALADGTGDDAYLKVLQDAIQNSLPLAEADAVFYLAGADPYQHDRLGRLGLSMSGLGRRDQLVLSTCRELDLPTTVVMAGGYAETTDKIVDLHAQTVSLAAAQAVPCCTRIEL